MRSSSYPLTLPALAIGAVAGTVLGLFVDSFLVGFAVFVLLVTVGGTWHRDEAPIFPFIFGYQWLAVSIGRFYVMIAGEYATLYAPGDLERAEFLSLAGLLILAAGIRLVSSRFSPAEPEDAASQVVKLSLLFWFLMAAYGVDYLYVIDTTLFANVAVILDRLMEFRQILLLLLWWEVVRRRTHFHYLAITLVWVFVPLLGHYFSDFKLPLVLLFIVFASMWRPWERSWWRFSVRQVVQTAAVVTALVIVALVWQAGVKKDTRRIYDAEAVSRDPIDRVSLFVRSATDNVPLLLNDPRPVVDGLVDRISYVTFFSRALDYVPKIQPHANGELFEMALVNAFVPRFLFPDKPRLPSDSYYTRRFTGIPVPEDGTSISIGYMAEFYVDWGVWGMMGMIFFYGCWIGLAYGVVRRYTRPRILLNPVLATVFMSVYQFEHQFIKTFAALNVAVVVVLAIVILASNTVVGMLDIRPIGAPDEPVENGVDLGGTSAAGILGLR